MLTKTDTTSSITQTHRDALGGFTPCGVRPAAWGRRQRTRGERSVWSLLVDGFRKLAHHSAHADILHEQIVAARA